MRRLFLIEESLDRETQWAVFEPNDEPFWHSIRSSIESFFLDLFELSISGSLEEPTPEEEKREEA